MRNIYKSILVPVLSLGLAACGDGNSAGSHQIPDSNFQNQATIFGNPFGNPGIPNLFQSISFTRNGAEPADPANVSINPRDILNCQLQINSSSYVGRVTRHIIIELASTDPITLDLPDEGISAGDLLAYLPAKIFCEARWHAEDQILERIRSITIGIATASPLGNTIQVQGMSRNGSQVDNFR